MDWLKACVKAVGIFPPAIVNSSQFKSLLLSFISVHVTQVYGFSVLSITAHALLSLASLGGQSVEMIRLISLELHIRIVVLNVNAKEAVKHFAKLAEFRSFFRNLTPAVQHDVIAGQSGRREEVRRNKGARKEAK